MCSVDKIEDEGNEHEDGVSKERDGGKRSDDRIEWSCLVSFDVSSEDEMAEGEK